MSKQKRLPKEKRFKEKGSREIDARKACATSVGGDNHNIMNQFCINDVMATGDLELAEDPFYRASFAGAE